MQEVVGVELKTKAFRLLDYPVKGFIGESIGCVAAAHIAVDARKPSLLEFSGPAERS